MEWFHIWWQGLGLVGQFMACAAIPMTIVMFLQLILMIIGVGFGGDSDGDMDGDGAGIDAGTDAGFDADTGFDTGIDFDTDLDVDLDVDAGADFSIDMNIDPDVDVDTDAGVDIISSAEAVTHDFSHGFSHHHSPMKFLTVRGIVAFFALGGWAGLAALTAGLSPLMAVMIALLAGAAAMVVASLVIRFALRMQSSGNISLRNAVTQTAEVYITIPPLRANTGKITMVLQERFVELDAVTDSAEPIKPKTIVEIVDTAGRDCLVVRPVNEESEEMQ